MGLKTFFRINLISFHIEGANAEENCDLRAGNPGKGDGGDGRNL